MLDFEEINKEAIKLVATEVKYPDNLPKGGDCNYFCKKSLKFKIEDIYNE